MMLKKSRSTLFQAVLISLIFVVIQNVHAKTDVPVFLLTGQSNMSGYASANDLNSDQKQEVENVKIFASMTWEGDNSKERKWLTLGPGFGSGAGRIGPELSMGRKLSEELPDTKIALLKICCGSTYLGLKSSSPNDCWVPPSSNNGTPGNHYQIMLDTIAFALKHFNDAYDTSEYTPRWAGFVWLQGEFDGQDRGLADAYEKNLTNLINDVREDLEIDDLPFIIPMIDVQNSWQYNAQVRAAEVAVTEMENVDTLDTKGFETDGVHYRAQGQWKIGTITAERWLDMEYEYGPKVTLDRFSPVSPSVQLNVMQHTNLPLFDLSGRKFLTLEHMHQQSIPGCGLWIRGSIQNGAQSKRTILVK